LSFYRPDAIYHTSRFNQKSSSLLIEKMRKIFVLLELYKDVGCTVCEAFGEVLHFIWLTVFAWTGHYLKLALSSRTKKSFLFLKFSYWRNLTLHCLGKSVFL